MAIAVAVRGDDPAAVRRLARRLEAVVDAIEVVAISTTAEGAEQAVATLSPDVVLLDLDASAAHAAAEASHLRTLAPSTRAVVVSASDDEEDAFAAFRFGASAYVVRETGVTGVTAVAETVEAVGQGRVALPSALVARLVDELDRWRPHVLGAREREVLAGIEAGNTAAELASGLGVTERTIHRRIEDVLAKLHLAARLVEAEVRDESRGHPYTA